MESIKFGTMEQCGVEQAVEVSAIQDGSINISMTRKDAILLKSVLGYVSGYSVFMLPGAKEEARAIHRMLAKFVANNKGEK